MDTRAQSIGLSRFILALIVGAPIIWIVNEITGPILSEASSFTSHSQANQSTTWIQQAIDFLPIAFVLIGFFGLLVLAIFQRELLR